MPTLQQFDEVVLLQGVVDAGIPPGTRAAVIDVHGDPPRGYEVEVVDADIGRMLWWGSVKAADLAHDAERYVGE